MTTFLWTVNYCRVNLQVYSETFAFCRRVIFMKRSTRTKTFLSEWRLFSRIVSRNFHRLSSQTIREFPIRPPRGVNTPNFCTTPHWLNWLIAHRIVLNVAFTVLSWSSLWHAMTLEAYVTWPAQGPCPELNGVNAPQLSSARKHAADKNFRCIFYGELLLSCWVYVDGDIWSQYVAWDERVVSWTELTICRRADARRLQADKTSLPQRPQGRVWRGSYWRCWRLCPACSRRSTSLWSHFPAIRLWSSHRDWRSG